MSESNNKEFKNWLKEVDKHLILSVSLGHEDMEDWDWWNEFDAGTAASEAASLYLEMLNEYYI